MSDDLFRAFDALRQQKDEKEHQRQQQEEEVLARLRQAQLEHPAVRQNIEGRLNSLAGRTPDLRELFRREQYLLSFTSQGVRHGSQTFDRNDIQVVYHLITTPGSAWIALRDEAMWAYCNTSTALKLGPASQLEYLGQPPEDLVGMLIPNGSYLKGFSEARYNALIIECCERAKRFLDDQYLAQEVFYMLERDSKSGGRY